MAATPNFQRQTPSFEKKSGSQLPFTPSFERSSAQAKTPNYERKTPNFQRESELKRAQVELGQSSKEFYEGTKGFAETFAGKLWENAMWWGQGVAGVVVFPLLLVASLGAGGTRLAQGKTEGDIFAIPGIVSPKEQEEKQKPLAPNFDKQSSTSSSPDNVTPYESASKLWYALP